MEYRIPDIGILQDPRPTPTPALAPSSNPATTSLPTFTAEEVAAHCTAADVWVVVDGGVYDVTAFKAHPGGFRVLERHAGKDATHNFNRAGHRPATRQRMAEFQVGVLKQQQQPDNSNPTASNAHLKPL